LLAETVKEISDIQGELKKIKDSKADAPQQKFRSCFACVISGSRREVYDICAVLGFYAA
jgi:hypothetical protein